MRERFRANSVSALTAKERKLPPNARSKWTLCGSEGLLPCTAHHTNTQFRPGFLYKAQVMGFSLFNLFFSNLLGALRTGRARALL